MRAVQYYGRGDVRIEDVDPAEVGPGQVRVDVSACGICGSDLHEYVGGPITIPTDPHPVTGESVPITIGHEFAGTVTEVGPDAHVDVGTEVAVNPIIWCGACQYCDEGKYRLCPSGGFVGLSGRGGGFAENVVVPAETAVPLPDGVSLRHAALAEPFTVGLHAVRRSGVGPGDAVAIFGTGPIGLTVLQAVHAVGAGPVIVSEPRSARRQLAAECGADFVIDPMETDPSTHIPDVTNGGVNVAFEVAGVEETVNQSMYVTRGGGTITIVSLYEEKIPVDLINIVTAEQRMVGTAAFQGGPLSHREFSTTLRYFADGRFDPAPLVSSRIDLGDIVSDGFERLLDEQSDEIKILVRP